MGEIANRFTITFTDAKESTAKMQMYTTASTAESIRTLLRNVSNCAIERASCVRTFVSVDDAPDSGFWTAGVYDGVEDKAILEFQDVNGGIHQFALPGPDDADFQADKETVNKLNSAIADLITHFLAHIVTRAGVALAEYVRGWRDRKRTQKTKPGILPVPP